MFDKNKENKVSLNSIFEDADIPDDTHKTRYTLFRQDTLINTTVKDNNVIATNTTTNITSNEMSEKQFTNQYKNDLRVAHNNFKIYIFTYFFIVGISILLMVFFKKLFIVYHDGKPVPKISISLFYVTIRENEKEESKDRHSLMCADYDKCSSCGFDLDRVKALFDISCSDLNEFKIAGIIVN